MNEYTAFNVRKFYPTQNLQGKNESYPMHNQQHTESQSKVASFMAGDLELAA
jgi:hypothetical protein